MAIWAGLAKAFSGGEAQPEQNPLEGVLQVRAYREGMFCGHAAYLLERYLLPWSLTVLPCATPPEPGDSRDVPLVVLVDDRPSMLMQFTVLNALLMGRLQMGMCVYTTRSRLREVKRLLSPLEPWVQVRALHSDIQSINRSVYNNLLKSVAFWQDLPARRILIVQQDALQIAPVDACWFDYDYVGAPWTPMRHLSTSFPVYSPDLLVEMASRWETVVFSPGLDPAVRSGGNGGLSIRSSECMRAICEAEAHDSPDEEPEDVFFASRLPRYAANLPTLEAARQFCCESAYSVSIAAHASHLYLEPQEQALIYERHLKVVIGLITAFANR